MVNKEVSFISKTVTSSLEDKFNLEGYLEVLIRKKNLIFLTMAFSILVAMSYAFFTVPVYKVKVGFLPPKKTILPKNFPDGVLRKNSGSLTGESFYKNLDRLLSFKFQEFEFFKEEVFKNGDFFEREYFYKKFLEKLLSFKFQEEVFKNGGFIEKFAAPNSNQTPHDFLLSLNSKIKMKQDIMALHKLFSKTVYLEMVGTRPEVMAEYLDLLYKTAIKKIRAETLNNLQINLQRKIDLLNRQLSLAQKFNVIDNNFQYARPGAEQPKWFLSGEKVLEEEIRSAKLGMEFLLGKNKIKAINPSSQVLDKGPQDLGIADISQFKIEVVTVTQPSIPPTTPIKPRKFLIISIGVFMGLFLGIIIAFISDAKDNLKTKKAGTL